MKKYFLISVLLGALPISMMAQTDDLYFVPKKKVQKEVKAKATENIDPIQETYYSGSDRTVEEYNRLESRYEVIEGDSTTNDTINFSAVKGVFPDSLKSEDFEITKNLQRFDDYDIADNAAFWAGYEKGREDFLWHSPWYYRVYGWYGGWYGGWYDPWYYSSWYGWYDPFYDPWYYGWRSSWYDPWFSWGYGWGYPYRYGYMGYGGYYGWGYPHHYYSYGGGGRHYTNGHTGTQNHGHISFNGPRGVSNGRTTVHSSGTFGGSRIASSSDRSRFGTNGTRQSRLDVRNSGNSSGGRVTNSNGTFGGNRRYSGNYSSGSGSYSSSSGSYSSGSGSYSSSRSSGSFSSGGSSRGSSSSSSGSYSSSRSSGSYSSGSSSRSSSSSSSGSFGGSRSSGSTMGGSRSGGGGGGGSFGGRHR